MQGHTKCFLRLTRSLLLLSFVAASCQAYASQTFGLHVSEHSYTSPCVCTTYAHVRYTSPRYVRNVCTRTTRATNDPCAPVPLITYTSMRLRCLRGGVGYASFTRHRLTHRLHWEPPPSPQGMRYHPDLRTDLTCCIKGGISSPVSGIGFRVSGLGPDLTCYMKGGAQKDSVLSV